MAQAHGGSVHSGTQLASLTPWHHWPGAAPGLEVAQAAGGGGGMCGGSPDPIALWGLEVCELVRCQPWAVGLSPPKGGETRMTGAAWPGMGALSSSPGHCGGFAANSCWGSGSSAGWSCREQSEES